MTMKNYTVTLYRPGAMRSSRRFFTVYTAASSPVSALRKALRGASFKDFTRAHMRHLHSAEIREEQTK